MMQHWESSANCSFMREAGDFSEWTRRNLILRSDDDILIDEYSYGFMQGQHPYAIHYTISVPM